MGVVAVSLCSDQALAFCRAVKEADGRFHLEFEHVTVEGPAIDEKALLHALSSAASISTRCRLVAVPHPGFNYDTARCQQQMMLEDALESYLPDGGCVMRVRLVDRVEACQAVSRRPIKEEALTMVTGGDRSLRPEAEQYKTPLNDQLYLLQTEYMRQEAAKMLQDPTKCSNPEEAFAAYTAVSSHPGAFVHVADALWNAVSEARNSVSAGYKRSRAVGSFFYSDSYWGFQWSEEEKEDEEDTEGEELGSGGGKVQQQLELVPQPEHRAVRLKRQHRPAGMAT